MEMQLQDEIYHILAREKEQWLYNTKKQIELKEQIEMLAPMTEDIQRILWINKSWKENTDAITQKMLHFLTDMK